MKRAKKRRKTRHSFAVDLNADSIQLLSAHSTNDLDNTLEDLSHSISSDLYKSTPDQISSVQSFVHLSEQWLKISQNVIFTSKFYSIQMVTQARTMVSHWRWWNFLYNMRGEICEILNKCNAGKCTGHWLSPLMNHITLAYSAGKRSLTVHFPNIYPNTNATFSDAHLTNLHTLAYGPELIQCIANNCLSVVAQWIKLQPESRKHHRGTKARDDLWIIRGRLVNSILNTGHIGLLAVPSVFKAFEDPVPYIYTPVGPFNVSVAVQLIEETLLKSQSKVALLKRLTSQLLKAAPEIKPTLHNFLQYDVQCESEESDVEMHSSVSSSEHSSRSSSPALNTYPSASSRDSSGIPPSTVQDAVLHDRPSDPLLPPPMHVDVPCENIDNIAYKCAQWMKRIEPVVNSNILPNKYSKWVAAQNDQRNPYRDLASCRSVFKQQLCTYDMRNGRDDLTTLFSILVFRVILFNSKYALDGEKVIFSSLYDFTNIVAMHDEKYMCNKRAYSRQTIMNRTTDNATYIWGVAEQLVQWIRSLNQRASGDKPTYQEVNKKLLSMKIPSAGSLVRMLIMGDLCMENFVQLPVDKDFATMVLRMKLGAKKCLSQLRLISDDQPVVSDLNIACFLYFYDRIKFHAVRLNISPSTSMSNILQFEHLLCKVLRACNAKDSFFSDFLTDQSVLPLPPGSDDADVHLDDE